MRARFTLVPMLSVILALASHASADTPFFFSTNDPDGKIATGSRPDSNGKLEIETGDDFIATSSKTSINHATFTGLLTGGASLGNVTDVTVELYRVFPLDSDTGRTINVPTRANSPADVAFDTRSTEDGNLSFGTTVLSANFVAQNSVLNGINPLPNVFTGGEGPVTGTEVEFSVAFTTPFDLPADHYFFVPQVSIIGSGDFLWLSAPKPIVPAGTPFTPDLQSWIRNDGLDPDWLRIGTDITGQGPFNAAFSLTGTAAVPEASSLLPLGVGVALMGFRLRRRR